MKSLKISQSITDRKDESLKLYFKDVSKLDRITKDKEIELAKRIKSGDKKAIDILVKSNLRFVISVAKQYQNKGLDLVDLIQEGNLGLIYAAKKFNETKGYKFISYAVWWIRQSILKALTDQCRTVRVPMSQVNNINKVNKSSSKFLQLNERLPSIEELEYETGLKSEKINSSLVSNCKSISLENPINDDGCLLDIIPNNSDPVDEELESNDLIEGVRKILSKLSYRDSDILKMSFGITVQQLTNDEIANRFGIGVERVRQLQHKALSKIKKRFKDELTELL